MNAGTRTLTIAGPVGPIDVALDVPAGPVTGIGIVAHPHPLFGGTRDNKVAQTLARALVATGHACWRPNFRGVGGTAGDYDEGHGETEDLLAVVAAARAELGSEPATTARLVLAGFSFGSFVQTRVAARLREQGTPATRLVLVGPAVSRFEVEPRQHAVLEGGVAVEQQLQAIANEQLAGVDDLLARGLRTAGSCRVASPPHVCGHTRRVLQGRSVGLGHDAPS